MVLNENRNRPFTKIFSPLVWDKVNVVVKSKGAKIDLIFEISRTNYFLFPRKKKHIFKTEVKYVYAC